MTRRIVWLVVAVAVVLALAFAALRLAGERLDARVFSSTAGFDPYALPLRETDRLFDVGVVDANGDGILDIYTSNHHFRQALLIGDGRGGYRDVLSDWGLDQSAFPMAELSFVAPKPDKPGVYVYWLGTDFVIRAHRVAELGRWTGSLHVFDPVEVVKADSFKVDKAEAKAGTVTETTLGFSAAADGTLVLRPGGQGLPLDFDFSGDIAPASIFVGRLAVSPKAPRFSLAMQDRHALAWADFNDDGVLDVFINRGALSGTLRAYPQPVAEGVRDELLLSRGPGAFDERGPQTGLEKKGCSGRHAQWIDFDADGLLDLFVNCYDREHFAGDFPKQLYRQHPRGTLRDVAGEVGLGLPEEQMANLVWFDVDGDGDADLLAFQDQGLFLYRHDKGAFVRETVLARATGEAAKIGRSRGNFWLFDGKFTVADFDGDGALDVFSSSKRGNVLLRNRRGWLEAVDPAGVGLPSKSITANWVDYDNDGLPDLHLVPQGLYRQRPDHAFGPTGLLEVEQDRYQAAIVNWLDFDNDGRLDVLLALDENPDFGRWWQLDRQPKRRGRWQLVAMRNVAAAGHWLQLSPHGGEGNAQGIGATVTVTAGGRRQVQTVGASEGSFFSQGHYRLYFGLGQSGRAEVVEVRWPDGPVQRLTDVAADRSMTIEREPRPGPKANTTGTNR